MTPAELTTYVTARVQFVGDELTQESILAAADDALALYNRYKPKIDRVYFKSQMYNYTFTSNIPDMVLRVYPSWDEGNVWDQNNPAVDWQYKKPTLFNLEGDSYVAIVGYYMTLDDANPVDPDHINLMKLIIAKNKQFVSNPRRSATMNELPFELSGQSFYDEAVQEEETVLEEIKNELQIWW